MVTGGKRNALNREVGVDGHRDWSHGLFSCTEECCLCESTSHSCMPVDPISLQAAGPPGVPAWSIPRPSSASNICRTEAPLYRVGVKDIMPIVAFMAAWLSPAMLGSYRYVESAASCKWARLTRCSDRKPREYSHTIRHPWGHYGRLPHVLVLPFLFAHAGAPRN
jgi:hypothetical protein